MSAGNGEVGLLAGGGCAHHGKRQRSDGVVRCQGREERNHKKFDPIQDLNQSLKIELNKSRADVKARVNGPYPAQILSYLKTEAAVNIFSIYRI